MATENPRLQIEQLIGQACELEAELGDLAIAHEVLPTLASRPDTLKDESDEGTLPAPSTPPHQGGGPRWGWSG